MRYVDLTSDFKRQVSGSITKALELSDTCSFEEIFEDWYDRKLYVLEDGLYFNHLRYKPDDPVVDQTYRVDEEFVEDVKGVMLERYDRKLKRC